MDVILAGSGAPLRQCGDLLARAGFDIGRGLDHEVRCPVILGDMPHLFAQALSLVQGGRHVLITNPASLSPSQTTSLLATRRPRQAVFLWSERRHHPAYRLVSGLIRSDEAGWQPRYIRLGLFSAEKPTTSTLRWRAAEGLAVLLDMADREPLGACAHRVLNRGRASADFVSVNVEVSGALLFMDVGLGEGIERAEMVVVANERKAYIDEMNFKVPVRLADDCEGGFGPGRWVSCVSPGRSELARQQCLAFLEGATSPARSQAEADTWLRVSACWNAIEASMEAQGAPVEVSEPAAPAFRVISGNGLRQSAVIPPLRVVG